MSWKGDCLIVHWFLCCFWFLMSFFWFFLVFCRFTSKPYNWYWKSVFYWVYWGDLNVPNDWLPNLLFWCWLCFTFTVKEAFDHISVHQLLTIMYKLQLSKEIQTWTEFFLQKRKAGLAFDEEKQDIQDIEIEIPQGSSISPILFLIYIRFLFSKIKAKFSQVQKSSYIDDVTLYTSEKSATENSELL